MFRNIGLGFLVVSLSILAVGQTAPTLVGGSDLKKVVPDTYFFRGLSATVQERNAGALKYPDGLLVIAALVDTSGYSTDIKAKYDGLFITEKTLNFGGKTIVPGEYGMGYNPQGQFHILDVAGNELAVADLVADTKEARPMPLKMSLNNGEARLYRGKKYVVISAQ
jgi:hypothetical protein